MRKLAYEQALSKKTEGGGDGDKDKDKDKESLVNIAEVDREADLQSQKFSDTAIRWAHYTAGYFMCLFLSQRGGWWPNHMNCWVDMDEDRPIELEAYYVWELSFYLSGMLVDVLMEEHITGDFWVMLVHHIATIWLILFSYIEGYHRIGILVLLVHNNCDIFLEGAKLFHYHGMDMQSNAVFVVLLLAWPYWRLYIYPTQVIWSAAYGSGMQGVTVKYIEGFVGFLSLLWFLHVYWYYLILRVAYRSIVSGGAIEDVRDEEAIKRQDDDTKKMT